MKRILAFLLTAILLFCLTSCGETKTTTAEDSSEQTKETTVESSAEPSEESSAEPSEESSVETPVVGSEGVQYGFLIQKEDGSIRSVQELFIDFSEEREFVLSYGYIDENGEAVRFAGKYGMYRLKERDEPVEGIDMDPYAEFTEECRVRIDCDELGSWPVSLFFRTSSVPGVTFADLPIIPTGDMAYRIRQSSSSFLQKGDDGSYTPIDYISVREGITKLTVAYGEVRDGELKLYDTKYWAWDIDGESGYLTVSPSGLNTKDCDVCVNTDETDTGYYLYCEPDNCPGVISDALQIAVEKEK